MGSAATYRDSIAQGRLAFAHLVRGWHARNGWSHRVLPALAEALDVGRVHNSQLSMLRNGKLASPGPEVFLALGCINRWLAEHGREGRLERARLESLLLAPPPDLLDALQSSAQPVCDDRGTVLGPGELLEVFVGQRQPPPSFDLRVSAEEASALSAALAQLFTAGRPWRQCRELLLAAYPVGRRQRRDLFAAVMAGQQDYSATELEAELPDLRRTLAALGVAGEEELGADQFLELLRQRARQWGPGSAPEAAAPDLARAIRRQLGVAEPERTAGASPPPVPPSLHAASALALEGGGQARRP